MLLSFYCDINDKRTDEKKVSHYVSFIKDPDNLYIEREYFRHI